MDYITKHEGYQYVSLVLATTFLLPQTVHSWYTRRMDDVSAISLGAVLASSLLWALYLGEQPGLAGETAATLFVSANSGALLLGKAYLWVYAPPPAPELLDL